MLFLWNVRWCGLEVEEVLIWIVCDQLHQLEENGVALVLQFQMNNLKIILNKKKLKLMMKVIQEGHWISPYSLIMNIMLPNNCGMVW